MPVATSFTRDLRKLLAFGSGVGIEIGATDLEVVVARVRPSGVQVSGRLTIENFATRPASEWGAEYAAFLKSVGGAHVSATVLLPRREVIMRPLALAGVASKDIENAIRFQIDSLHPYGEDEISWGWSPVAPGTVLIGIVRRASIDRYVELFSEAGVPVASFTFSAAAVHAAIRLNGHQAGAGFVALRRTQAGGVEVYGESDSRPLFSAEFDMTPERATAFALAELRLPPETSAFQLEEVLPRPTVNPVANDLARNPLPYATALAGACPRLAPSANVLPAELRRSSSRAIFLPSIVLAGLLALVALGMLVWNRYSERQYLQQLHAEIFRLEPLQKRADVLDRSTRHDMARIRLLDQYRDQTRADLDSLNELTRLLDPPAWASGIDLTATGVRIYGEAPQAAPLLKILDSSPFFQDSSMDMAQRSPSGQGEVFQIHSNRRPR